MTGDSEDVFQRLRSALPRGWFADDTPILDALLRGFASGFAFIYSLFAYAKLQTRILTATDGWLDLIAKDFFGDRMPRNGQLDPGYRAKILANLFRERGTRRALVRMLTDLTGREPLVFEPRRPADAACLGETTWLGHVPLGSDALAFQCFVDVRRAPGSGIPTVAGLGSNEFGLGQSGTAALVNLDQILQSVTDADIYEAIESVKPVGTIVWTRISD